MGDISELRGLVVIGSFVGVLVLLLLFIPPEFYVSSYEGRTVTPPTEWESGEMLYFVDTVNVTIETMLGSNWEIYVVDIGDHATNLYDGVDINLYYTDDVRFVHFYYWWIFATGHHYHEWINFAGVSRSFELTPAELNEDYTNGNFKYSISDEHFKCYSFPSFNISAYATPEAAWAADELNFMFAIEFDQVNTSVNAWSIISMLLFFGLPNVHSIVNAIISIPLWIAIAYISYILVLRAIGAIFGGGGA